MERSAAKKRVNKIALARFEQWALPRMAKRLPGWITPDTLTGIGLVAALGIGVSYWLTQYSLDWLWLANILFVVHWWGDSLDGTLARVRKIQRERYGFYVDHQSDAVSALLLFGGLAVSPLMQMPIAMALLIGYYLMMIMVSLVTIARDVFKISFAGIGPTEGRLLMVFANIAVWFWDNPSFIILERSLSLFDILGLIGAAGMLLLYTVNSLIERSILAKLDPPPAPGSVEPVASVHTPEHAVVDD